jgi:hypothetical protein
MGKRIMEEPKAEGNNVKSAYRYRKHKKNNMTIIPEFRRLSVFHGSSFATDPLGFRCKQIVLYCSIFRI